MERSAVDIVISDLRKSFGQTVAVQGLSLSVARGQMAGLVGPDGAGKTTTLRILCSLLRADGGSCRVRGLDVEHNQREVKRLIGYMPQRFSLYPDLTVAENLRFFADLFQVAKGEREERIEKLLAFSRLGPFQKRRAAALSGGMKQKLALSCTLIHRPEILLLDEPTTGVDPVSRREFWNILVQLRAEGVTILLTTPYMDEAARCDDVAFVHQGRVIAEGPPAEVGNIVRHPLLEVRCALPLKASRALQGCAGILGVHAFGDHLRVTAADPATARREIRTQLRAAGIPVYSIKETRASMSDVFSELTGK